MLGFINVEQLRFEPQAKFGATGISLVSCAKRRDLEANMVSPLRHEVLRTLLPVPLCFWGEVWCYPVCRFSTTEALFIQNSTSMTSLAASIAHHSLLLKHVLVCTSVLSVPRGDTSRVGGNGSPPEDVFAGRVGLVGDCGGRARSAAATQVR